MLMMNLSKQKYYCSLEKFFCSHKRILIEKFQDCEKQWHKDCCFNCNDIKHMIFKYFKKKEKFLN